MQTFTKRETGIKPEKTLKCFASFRLFFLKEYIPCETLLFFFSLLRACHHFDYAGFEEGIGTLMTVPFN